MARCTTQTLLQNFTDSISKHKANLITKPQSTHLQSDQGNMTIEKPDDIQKSACYFFSHDHSKMVILRVAFTLNIPILYCSNKVALICTSKHNFNFITNIGLCIL